MQEYSRPLASSNDTIEYLQYCKFGCTVLIEVEVMADFWQILIFDDFGQKNNLPK